MAKEKAKEVTLEVDAKGIPIWKDKNGNPIKDLEKKYFFANVKPEDKDDATKAHIEYLIACKEIKKEQAMAKLASYEDAIEALKERLTKVGVELSEEEKLDAQIAKYEKMKEKALARKAALAEGK